MRRITLWILAIISLLGAIFVYATIDRTEVLSEQLIIIPDTVVTDGWIGSEKTQEQDLSPNSLYQDFSPLNSAFIDLDAVTIKPQPESTPGSSNIPAEDSASTSTSSTGSQGTFTSTNSDNGNTAEEVPSLTPTENQESTDPITEPVPPVEVEPEPEPQIEPEPEPEPQAENSTSEATVSYGDGLNLHWGVLPLATQFPLAQEIISTAVTTTESADVSVTPTEPEPQTNETSSDEAVDDNVLEENADDAGVDEIGTDEGSVDDTSDQSLIDENTSEVPVDDYVPTPAVGEACGNDAECKMYGVTFSGFAMPEFDSGKFVTSAQLRLSLAGRTFSHNDTDPQRFVVEYSYADSDSWQVATIIDIEDETANSVNGGYYLVSLDRPTNADLSNLKVRVSYQGNINNLQRAYIESVWLEIVSSSFYEKTGPNDLTDEIDYGRDLLEPEFHQLNNEDNDSVLSHLPAFTLSYSPQQNFLKRAFNAIFSENEYKVDKVRLLDQSGAVIDVPFEIIYQDDKVWTIQFLKQPQKLVPGKYKLEVTINENENLYTDNFEFYWGVLAVNTTKSMYFQNEDITLNLAALTDKGDTICDAHLELKIIDPTNNIYEVPVEQSGECGKNNVTDVPDYLAHFNSTGEFGEYKIQLQHFNKSGEMVHKITDTFEVREYIPYDIERTAPTRIYPPAPYEVGLNIKAYREFTGDITERVPRGFVVENYGDAEIATLPEYTELIWRDVHISEGDTLRLGYTFDAPNVSPYMYLLGPLNMDGFTELRQWQIASDALSAIGWFTGTQTVNGSNLNAAPSPLVWSTSTMDNYYYSHSTSTDQYRVTIKQPGDYLLAVTLPQQRTDGNSSRTRVGVEVRVNGVAVPEGLGRSGYIRNASAHSESSAHDTFLLTNLSVNDYIEVYLDNLTTIDAGDIVNVTGQAGLYLEYMSSSRNVFAATTTETTNSTNLNQTTAYPMKWTETRQDAGFTHSDSVNPENIIIANPGTYMVTVNIPLSGDTAQQGVLGRVLLSGGQVSGGVFAQGFTQSAANESDGDSSIHWSGIVTSTTTNQILTITTERDGAAGTSSVTTGFVGSIFMEELPSTDVISLTGTDLVSGTDWDTTPASAVKWDTRTLYDSGVFTHSTSSNNEQITVNQDGSYLLVYNDAMTSATARANNTIEVAVNGTPITGAQTKSHYMRNQSGHNNSSASLVYLLENLSNTDIITVTSIREAANATTNDTTPASLLIWKKLDVNERPAEPTMYDTPFDNIRFSSTTPYFQFSASDPDGTSDIRYEFSISTSSSFSASTTRVSGTDSGFTNTASSTDTSPFVEGNKISFQLQPADALTDKQTYYWRVRAMDVTGSGNFGDWSTTQSLTVDSAVSTANWYQTFSGQFDSNNYVGTLSTASDGVEINSSVNSEILLVYGEGTVTTPRYRFWNGTTWSVEGSAQAVTNTINWIKTAAGTTRDEYAMVTLDQSSDAYAQIYNASTSSWGNVKLLSPVVTSNAYRGIAVGYESVSGDAMAVSCSDDADPVYSIWNGSSWSATSTITVSSANNCNFLDIASDPTSDEMILVVRDTGTQYEALVWDGSAWVYSNVIGSSALLAREGMSVVYESSGDQAIIVVSDNTANDIYYTTWDGTQFSSNATQPLQGDFEFGRLTADPDSDSVALCYIDTDNDIGVLQWNGGVWDTYQELDGSGNIDTGRPQECAYETSAGRSDRLLMAYSDTAAVRYTTATSTVWDTEGSIDTLTDSFWVQAERADDGTIMVVALDDVADSVDASTWNGTSWSAKDVIESNPSSVAATPYEMFDMAAKKFRFSNGTVETQPIDFAFVPSQPTWGDINFSTTEPFGTDVLLRVKYSSSTPCDTYISNGALSGNSAGFDVSSSPIDLTSLSTSTYSQICLEATLFAPGSVSPSLDNWSLSWVREAKLVQNNYRWYVNGSFLTPTDPWPVGVGDLSENSPITSDQAVNINDVVRLRLSVQDQNVPFPVDTSSFKLQYASGLTCSSATDWNDVGDSASTTAEWRGYENSIVGDDWYDANWGRRIKITVDQNVVEEGLTDFPVYLNLADLPSVFFDNVQSDGDDVRITEVDGVTELPYDLVAIDTALDTGELHFKADLASTTDTEFYIYYGNSGASGYSASATYGSQNVWTNSYSLRYKMNENPAGSSPQFKDSTSNANNAVAYSGMTSGDVVTGKIGSGIDLDGNDGGTFQSALAYAGVFTASMWWNANGDGFAIAGPAGANEKMGPWSSPAGRVFARTSTASSDTTVTHPTDGTWSYVVLTRDSSNKVDLYINGTTTRLFSDAAQTGNSDWINFGGETTQGFRGILDELRFSSVKRTAGWIATEFNNQSNTTGFYDVSAEELISDGRLLPSTVLNDSDYPETYEEQNPTEVNKNTIPVGDEAEWDFVLQNNGGVANTNYCFRMVYSDGSLFNTYTNYPSLITNAPPVAPVLSAPFDNEQLASTTPWFDFAADDELGDEVSYQIQVSTDVNFASTVIDNDSINQFSLFTNLSQPAQKSQFTSGETIRYEPGTALSNGNTYWWRVRADDPDGSGATGDWSDPHSFTVNTGTVITTWYQTTGDQFSTNNLFDAVTSTSSNDTGIESGFTSATTTSTDIDFDDKDTGNAWGQLSFTHNVTSGSIKYYVEYLVSGSNYALIPNTALAGNSSGFTSSPVSLVNLDTTTYNQIRLVAVLSGNSTLPRLQDWTVTWSETIDDPTQISPFDNAKVSTTTPSFTFFTTDPQSDDLQYELQLSSTYDFAASSTFLSGVDAGFTSVASSTDTSPFTSSTTVKYVAQSALTNGNTYWWRIRAKDPSGGNSWSSYSDPHSFTVDTSISTSIWHQTTGEQFATNELSDIETTSGTAKITSIISQVLLAYGEGTGQAPQYRSWNGSSWGSNLSAETVGAQISWLELKAAPTRPEYALGTLGTDLDVNFQIFDTSTSTWGDLFEIQTDSVSSKKRTFNLAYETTSGDLLAVACNGTEAMYSVWNGTSWSATSSISLTNANNCEFVQMASDPTSDEIIAVFRHTNTSANDYEAMVWNGTSWGNASQFGELDTSTNEGMAVAYEESGGQAIVAVSNSPATTLLYNIWNGSSWSGTSTHVLGDRIEWATLKADVGTDRLALCYIDNDSDVGVAIWDGSAWGAFTELTQTGNSVAGRPIDCEFETGGSRDGYLMAVYSDTLVTAYQDYNGSSWSGQISIDVITDTFEDNLVRAKDGVLHLSAYDDALSPDRIDHSRWDGSAWSARERFSNNASLNGASPYAGGSSLAPQLYPNFTSGSMRSTAINFSDGTGPRWDTVSWNETTPGASYIEYRVYYESAPDVFTLIPDAALSGNSSGFTSGPIDIADVDRNTYAVLQLGAQFVCDAGNCPVINDWSVAWAEGLTVSGNAYDYDGVSTTTSGTVAVAVNGALQAGKTGAIAGDGTWSIANVTTFPGDTVTVFVDGASDSDEAVAIATYNGVGNISGMELTKRHITIGSSGAATTTNAGFASYDNTDDEDLFFTVGAGNALTLCVESACVDGRLKIKSGTNYAPGANVTTNNFLNYGTFTPATNTIRVASAWNNQGTFIADTSTIIFTATTSSSTLQNATSTFSFYNLTFGETTGSSTWNVAKPLTVTGNLSINYGTLARGTSTIGIAQNLQIGASGYMTGLATTTFNGSGSYTWGDAKASTTSSNIGYTVVDGTAKTITLAGNVAAQSVTIGADDTLNSSGSGYNINVYAGWTNNNSFIAQAGTVTFVGTSTITINRGSSAFNNLTFNGVGGSWAFSTSTLALNGNLTIATGTVTLPTGTTTIAGSFLNTGGTFAHNNGEVRMTASVAGKTITQNATAFLNAFYDLVFVGSGSGSWSFTETNATTTRNLSIQAKTVTFPSGTLTVGGDFIVSGTGAFAHNNGEVTLLVQDTDDVKTNGSSFNNLRIAGAISSSWYGDSWAYRLPVTIQSSQIDANLTNFPVYVDLANLPSGFFTNVKSDGGDIRVTESDGVTEVPREVVSISTGSSNGELHFRATSVSSSTNSTYYIYYGNSAATGHASTSTYGARNVWSNGYVVVNHMGDLTTSSTLNSTGTINGAKTSANNPLGVTTGKVYGAQDISADSVQHAGAVLQNENQYSVSMWFNPDALTGGNADEQNFGRSLYGISAAGSPYQWLRVGGTANPTNLTLCAYDAGTACNVSSGAGLVTGSWHHVSINAVKSGATTLRVNGTERLSFTNTGSGNISANFTIADLRPARAINFDGRIDEVRVANATRTDAWRDAEYRNFATTTSFYTAGAVESSRTRNFTDTNATILGNLTLASGGDATFPSGTLSVGGSLSNAANFNSNSGTVRFNSTAGAETINAGSSTFATLEFNSPTGDFTITQNATSTVAVNLTNVQQFTLTSGKSLAVSGTFTNAATGTNTTWTGSTLRLLNGSTATLNVKTHAGDNYGTLESASSTLTKMWNSSADTYTVSGATAAIYSQDHAGVDGTLNIYGNYTRTTGTEYWSYATDFDGVALAGLSRQANIKVASSSNIALTNSSLSMLGTTTASSTLSAISGAFAFTASNATLNNQYFTVAGTGANGLNLTASTTLTTFSDGYFGITPTLTGIKVDNTTVDKNPAKQLSNIGFATTSAGTASNVTLTGSPSSFIWFRTGFGGLYGEAFDSGDGNPGSIRFDDSAFLVTVSGTVYSDDGVATMGAPTCDGSTQNVRLVVDGGSYASSTSCNASTGAYSFTNVSYVGDPRVIVYLDTNGGQKGSVVTKTLTGNVTNMNIYANRVIVRHEDVTALGISDMIYYDNDNDSDISFVAATGTPNTLNLLANTELYVKASSTFTPNGNLTLGGNGNSNSYEGTLVLATSSSFIAQGTETHTLAGRLVLGSSTTFTTASSSFIFNATTTGKSITSLATTTFNDVTFNGTGGGWNITSNLSVLGNMNVTAGTVTGTGNITMSNGSVSGNGVLSMGGGTVRLNKTNTLGGSTAWTFNNLVLGSGSVVGTTTPASTATTTILGTLTISNAHLLDANDSSWDLAGTGTVMTETGTLLEDTSTFRFSGAGANVPSTNYYNLRLDAGAGSPTYTGIGSGILVLNDLVVGGSANSTFTVNTTDQTLEVRGNVSILSNGTVEASNSANLTVLGNWTNQGTFNSNSGTVRFMGTGTSNINAGNSNFSTVLINGTGDFNVTNHATATTAWRLQNHNNFTVSSGQTLAVGGEFDNNLAGANTTWTGTTLSLYGNGTYSINASTTADNYENLKIGSSTQVRMWNSDAVVYDIHANGSLYSQDHAGVSGSLYIYGKLVRSSGNDYWSYANDFDGTSLSGGSERIANVYFASGATAVWNGASLSVIGSSTASTTLQNQGSGTYGLTIGTGASTTWSQVQIRNTDSSGIVFAGTPTVNGFSYTDHLVEINSGTAMTVGGTVINQNPAINFTGNKFEAGGGVISPVNVTATGTSVSSWRFATLSGNISGEAFDSDPDGDPGYIVWPDSAALITVSGNVYSDEGSTVSTVCDGVTSSIRLEVANLTTYDTTCAAGTGAYSISNVAFGPTDTLTLYINGTAKKAANVTNSPISSISNMHLYENRVIVRHEGVSPLTIAKMVIWDSSDDPDIPFTAVSGGTDTLTLPADTKLLVWTGKTFEPNGNVTLSGGGAGGAEDGTLEVQTSGQFTAKTTETHSIGGNMIFGTSAVFVPASSTVTLTTTGASRTVDVNANNFHNLTFSGSGSWSITDPTLTVNGSYTQSNGTVTFPTGTTTVASAFNVTGGSFNINNSPLLLTSRTGGTTVRFNNSQVANLTFQGTGGTFNMTDTNATATGAFKIASGTVSLPSGNFAVGGNFENIGGTITHNTSDLIMTATTTAILNASSSDLYAVIFAGAGSFTLTKPSITLLSSLTINAGTVTVGTGTTAIGGSFLATGGTFVHSSGTVLLNATSTGHTINVGSNNLYNLQIGAPAGGYTMLSATTTNNFTIANANSLTVQSGATIAVGGVFTNSVGGAATTWTNTTLRLNSATPYSLNSRSNSGDVYGTLVIGQDADVRMWYSNAATTTVASSSSLYSQDHNNVNGSLNIYGDFGISTTTEYWSYATDFDGTSLSGSERKANVYLSPSATTTLNSGALQIIGGSGNETTIQKLSTGTHAFKILGGTFNANNYSFADLDINGLQLSNTTTITDLANGYFALAVNTGSLITLSSTTLNANPSLIFDNVGFYATSGISGFNVNLVGETSNAWRFTNNYGNIGGEGFDIDGVDACGSVRFDDSSCLITEQTHYRWRNDDGGEGGVASEWLADSSFDLRKRIRVKNNDNQTYASTSVKVTITYDSDMKSDFSDLRFTDSDGVTQVPFWVEKYTASTDAIVWILVPSLPASGQSELQMYYGSSTASSISSGSTVFTAFDDYEDNNITEYSGDTSLFNTAGSPVYGGSYALKPVSVNGKTTNGMFRFDQTISQGQIVRYMQYVNTTGTTDEPCTLFGVQSPGTTNQNYAVCLEQFGVDRISLAKNVKNDDVSGTVLATSSVTYATGWYEVEIDWKTSNDITAYLYNSAGTLVTSATANDSTYTSGGYGYAFWFQNGAWDSFTSRPRTATKPTTYIGSEQSSGGASWLAAQDLAGNILSGETARLRMAVENSGLQITGQQFRLEFAAKDVAPSCGSVSSVSYITVPNEASCGTSPVCMATSTNLADGDATTDHLTDTEGNFSAGKMVESPSNETSGLTVNQNYYTEMEYVIQTTSYANDSYCFRVTNAGTPLDFYGEIAELSLSFDPAFGAISLNQGQDISLTPGTTTAIYATGTVSDFNGYADLAHATATIYRSGAGASCTPDNNSCYVLSTENNSCSFTNCSGSSCTLSCVADMYFHADATDADTYEGQEWLAYMEAEDQADGYDFASAPGVELLTMRALAVDNSINYGALLVNSDTGSFNPTSTITNIGNTPINVDVTGTDLSDGLSSSIPASEQKVASSTFTYTACASCLQLSSTTPVVLGLNLSKPSVENPPVETEVFWGIAVPFTASNSAHSGANIFTAIGI